MQRIRREILLDASLEDVWHALSEPDGLSAWFGARVRIDLRAGGRIEFHWNDGGMRAATIEALAPLAWLHFRWLPFARAADGSTMQLPSARVEMTVRREGKGTLLTIEETMLTSGPSFADARTGVTA